MKKTDYAKIMEERVKKLFPKLLPQARLVRVEAKPGKDWEGDEILDVTVVFDGVEQLDVDKSLELRRRAWLDPSDEDDVPFPMFHILSKEDEKELEAIDLEEVLGPYES